MSDPTERGHSRGLDPLDLIDAARKQMELVGPEHADGAVVSLILPGPWPRSGRRRLVSGLRSAPTGDVVAHAATRGWGPGVVVLFNARELIEWLGPRINRGERFQPTPRPPILPRGPVTGQDGA